MALKDRLRAARLDKRLTQKALGDALGIRAAAISQWETGETVPDSGRLPEVARALGVRMTYLLEEDGHPIQPKDIEPNFVQRNNIDSELSSSPRSGPHDVPVYASAMGGADGMVYFPNEIVEWIARPASLRGVKDAFAVRVQGESMEPRYFQNEKVFVHPHRLPQPGRYHLFVSQLEDGSFQGVVKLLVKYDNAAWTVRQHNPDKTYKLPRAEWQKAQRIVAMDERD